MIQMVVCDMDGTFLKDDKSIPEKHMQLLDILSQKQIPFTVCTARPLFTVPQEIRNHPACKYVIVSNGAAIYDVKQKKYIYTRYFSNQDVKDLYLKLMEREIIYDVFIDDKIYTEEKRFQAIETYPLKGTVLKFVKSIRTQINIPIDQLIDTLPERIERVTIFFKHQQDKEYIEQLCHGKFACVSSLISNIEISHLDATKGNGLIYLTKYLNIDINTCMAFGDGNNDITMLQNTKLGYAMKNAYPSVLKVINQVTQLDNNQGGILDTVLLHL